VSCETKLLGETMIALTDCAVTIMTPPSHKIQYTSLIGLCIYRNDRIDTILYRKNLIPSNFMPLLGRPT